MPLPYGGGLFFTFAFVKTTSHSKHTIIQQPFTVIFQFIIGIFDKFYSIFKDMSSKLEVFPASKT
jgi:hypothetical protein